MQEGETRRQGKKQKMEQKKGIYWVLGWEYLVIKIVTIFFAINVGANVLLLAIILQMRLGLKNTSALFLLLCLGFLVSGDYFAGLPVDQKLINSANKAMEEMKVILERNFNCSDDPVDESPDSDHHHQQGEGHLNHEEDSHGDEKGSKEDQSGHSSKSNKSSKSSKASTDSKDKDSKNQDKQKSAISYWNTKKTYSSSQKRYSHSQRSRYSGSGQSRYSGSRGSRKSVGQFRKNKDKRTFLYKNPHNKRHYEERKAEAKRLYGKTLEVANLLNQIKAYLVQYNNVIVGYNNSIAGDHNVVIGSRNSLAGNNYWVFDSEIHTDAKEDSVLIIENYLIELMDLPDVLTNPSDVIRCINKQQSDTRFNTWWGQAQAHCKMCVSDGFFIYLCVYQLAIYYVQQQNHEESGTDLLQGDEQGESGSRCAHQTEGEHRSEIQLYPGLGQGCPNVLPQVHLQQQPLLLPVQQLRAVD